MNLEKDFSFEPVPAIADADTHPFKSIDDPLGPLAQLVGTWSGTGFNTIWRPHFPSRRTDRFLELNLTSETLEFEEIPGAIPNRGLGQKDIEMFGVHYLQQISDSTLSAGLHIEPGIWATVPKTTAPQEPPTVVRMASIPHGTAILVQGKAFTIAGPPVIDDTDIIPFFVGDPGDKGTFAQAEESFPALNLAKKTKFRQPSDSTTVPDITQAMVKNPNLVLQKAIHGQDIVRTTVLRINTHTKPESVGTANTFFLGENASANHVQATFWIQKVKKAHTDGHFLQLQYSQTVMLDFNGLRWPHVSVATLRKRTTTTPSTRDDLPATKSTRSGREVELT